MDTYDCMSVEQGERERERRKCACRLSCGQSIYDIPFPLSSNCEQDVNRSSCWHLPQCAPASPASVLSDSSTHCEVDEGEDDWEPSGWENYSFKFMYELVQQFRLLDLPRLFSFLSGESINSPIVIRLLWRREDREIEREDCFRYPVRWSFVVSINRARGRRRVEVKS